MGSDEQLKQRLREWGAWFNGAGAAAGAFPRKNILHPSWTPPSGGSAVVMSSCAGPAQCNREMEVQAAIGQLSDKLITAVVGKYARRMTSAQMALELRCSSAAVDGRLSRAYDQLRALLLST